MMVIFKFKSLIDITWECEEEMLNRGEGGGPLPIQCDQDKHQSLRVEWSPAEEEGKHHNNWKCWNSILNFYRENVL